MITSGYNDEAVKTICYDCGSPVAKQSYNYFRRLNFVTGGKVWCKVWCKDDGSPVAFYYANRCKDHIRLIEIAVRTENQGQGMGKKVLFSLLLRMKQCGLYKLTFRTPINEDAQGFWLRMGAKIVDVKADDYEMELNIK